MKKLILYDLDGTLVDTREDIVLAANHMLSRLGRDPLESREIEGYVGRGLHYLIQKCLKTADSKLVEKGTKLYREHYTVHMMDHSTLYPGVRETLNYFQDRSQAVLTNKPNPFSEQMLAGLGVAGYFFRIVAGNSGYPKKPDPKPVHQLLKEVNAKQAEAVLVGDSLIDIETGKNANIATVVLTHGFGSEDELGSAGPDFIVGGFDDLLEVARTNDW